MTSSAPTFVLLLVLAAVVAACGEDAPGREVDAREDVDAYQGCGPPVGYLSGLIVALEPVAPLPATAYTIAAEVEAGTLAVDITIEGGGIRCAAANPDCRDELAVGDRTLILTAYLFADDGTVNLYFNDGGGPAEVVIDVRAGEQSLARETFIPDYQTTEPWGPGCGQITDARATLSVAAPAAR